MATKKNKKKNVLKQQKKTRRKKTCFFTSLTALHCSCVCSYFICSY